MPDKSADCASLALLIRRNVPADAARLILLINAIAAENRWFVTEEFVQTPEWEHVLSHPADFPDHLLLIAESNQRIVGWCQAFSITFGRKSRHVADLGIGVAREWRDRGVGTTLLKSAILWAQQQGFEKLTLDTFSSNARARHVFEKIGFVQTGIRGRQYKINSEYVDQILMELWLAN